MPDKTYEEHTAGVYAVSDSGYPSGRGKVLAGYPVQNETEQPERSLQPEDEFVFDPDYKDELDLALEEQLQPEEEMAGPETGQVSDEQTDGLSDEQRQRIAIEQQQEIVRADELHKVLEAKLDAAIAIEKQQAQRLYDIENRKKNTLDYARSVYGDEADIDYIMGSAKQAQTDAYAASAKQMESAARDIDEKAKDSSQVGVLMPDGRVCGMDRDVALAMELYSERSRQGIMEQIAAGIAPQRKFEAFEFTRNEEEKLRQLYEQIEKNSRQQAAFEEKAPASMTQEEYNEYNRQRRFKEYGYPQGYEYVMTNEGLYEWNGRPLPSAMSSPTMTRELACEEEYGPSYTQPGA